MSNPEWGAKHLCQGCGAKFYDMGKNPIVCPSCDEPAMITPPGRSRRSRKEEVKEEPSLPDNKEAEIVGDEQGILSEEADDLIADDENDDAIATLADGNDDDDDDVLAEADIDTTKIADE